MFVPVTFFFDASGMADLQGDTVGIFGNFNAWSVPVPMHCQHKPSIFAHTVELPVDCDVCFKFVLNDKHVVSPAYAVVVDENGVSMNHVRVRSPPPVLLPGAVPASGPSQIYKTHLEEEAARPTPGLLPDSPAQAFVHPLYSHAVEEQDMDPRALAAAGASPAAGGGLGGLERNAVTSVPVAVPPRTLPVRITGVFEGVKQLSADTQQRLLESDWTKIRLADVLKSKHDRLAVKEVLRQHSEGLRQIFRHYASQGARDTAQIRGVTLLHVLRYCGVTDKQLAEAHLERVIHREGPPDDNEDDGRPGAAPGAVGASGSSSSSSSSSSSAAAGAAAAAAAAAAMAAASSGGAGGAGKLGGPLSTAQDSFNPEHSLARADLYEILVRVSLVRLPNALPPDALQTFIKHVSAHAIPPPPPSGQRGDVRALILDSKVQALFGTYGPTIWSAFLRFVSISMASTALTLGRRERRSYTLRTIAQKDLETFLKEYGVCDQVHLPLRKALSAFKATVAETAAASSEGSAGAGAGNAASLLTSAGEGAGELSFVGFLEVSRVPGRSLWLICFVAWLSLFFARSLTLRMIPRLTSLVLSVFPPRSCWRALAISSSRAPSRPSWPTGLRPCWMSSSPRCSRRRIEVPFTASGDR